MAGVESIKKENKRESASSRIIRRFKKHKAAVVSLVILMIFILAAVFAPLLTPYDPAEITIDFGKPPSGEHLLGTDAVGRDMLTRLLYGMRVSLLVGLLSTMIAITLGVVLGLISGYAGGAVDMIIMRFTDMVMSFPYILLVLVVAALVGPGLLNLIFIMGFTGWPGVARIVRGNVLSIKQRHFIENRKVQGMPFYYILFSEILPNTFAPVMVYATSAIAMSILDEAALSFLGMGVQSPTASLGNLLSGVESITVLRSQPWLWIPPGVVIVVLVVAINFIGDALRDAVDPHSEGALLKE
ncbi:MAG: ABC transporter permease [Clostridiales bacterium]|nr:ABC transporter permease [Clostridiales bacterium]